MRLSKFRPILLPAMAIAWLAALNHGTARADEVGVTRVWPRLSTPTTLSVYDMPRPFYDPLGIKLDCFIFYPSVSEQGAYDDSIFASDLHQVGTYINTTNETVSVASQWSHHSLKARAYSVQQVYADHPGEDANTFDADGSGRYDISPESFLQLDGGFLQQPQMRGAREANPDISARSIYNTATGVLTYSQKLNRWLIEAQASLEKIAYLPAGDRVRDRLSEKYRGRITYNLLDQIGVFLEGAWAPTEWRARSDLRNFDVATGLAGFSVTFPGFIDAEFGAGFERQNYRDDAFKTLYAPVLNGTLTWNVLPLTTILGSAARTITGTETFCNSTTIPCENGATVTPTLFLTQRNALKITTAEIAAQHEFWHNLLGELRFKYERDHFDLINLKDDVYTASANARYLVNRNLEIDFNYAHISRVANLPNDRTFNSGPYTENVVSVAAKAAF